MTMSQTATARASDPDDERLIPLSVKVVLAILLLGVVGLICYGIGSRHDTGANVVTGRAYVGSGQAGVRVGDRSYGIPVSDGSITWYDAHGIMHDGGIAPCLRHAGTYVWLRFGYSLAQGPDGTRWRQVSWVRCIPAP
jgi:hypothetical protein